MKVGMLWFDEDRDVSIGNRIQRASEYYHSKYGQKPNLCFIHPDTVVDGEAPGEGLIKVKSSSTLLEDHFWIGVEEDTED